MSWHLAIQGHFKFVDAGDDDRWATSALEPGAMKDLAEASPEWFQARFRKTTVGALLADVGRFNETSGHEFLYLTLAKGQVTVRGLLSEGNLPDWLERVVAALQAAASLGAKGAIVLVGMGDPLLARLTLARKKAVWEVLSEAALPRQATRAIEDEISALSKARTEPRFPERPARAADAKEAGWYLALHGRGKLTAPLTDGGWAKMPLEPSVMKDLATAHPEWFKGSARTPETCASLGYTCGTAGDGCGGSLDCGACKGKNTCGGGGTPYACGH
jgi:hypothetical protein